jgi:CheY-like chemotaxis protein
MVQEMEHEASMRVLVIDDETAAREGMALLLSDWGHEVISAGSLIEALRLLERAPDVIIADYRLRQGQTGIDAIHDIQAKWGSGIPSLIVTGDTAPERLREAQASGFAFMHKPVNAAKLRAFLRSVARHGNLAS